MKECVQVPYDYKDKWKNIQKKAIKYVDGK